MLAPKPTFFHLQCRMRVGTKISEVQEIPAKSTLSLTRVGPCWLTGKQRDNPIPQMERWRPGEVRPLAPDRTTLKGKGWHFKEEECFKMILASKNSAWLGLVDSKGSGFMTAPICFSGTVQPSLLWL